MSKNLRFIAAAFLFLAAALYSFAVPKHAGYAGASFITSLAMPETFAEWKGEDLSEALRDNLQGAEYKFVSEALAYRYTDKDNKSLLFMIINARDFHYPNACFRSSGYKVAEMKNTGLDASGRSVDAHTFIAEHRSKGAKTLILYWIVIDRKPVGNWAEQKMKQLYFSLFDKNNIGLLVRLDIPVEGDNVQGGLALAQKLADDLSGALSAEEADHIFGNNN